MSQYFIPGAPDLSVTLKRSARAKRYSLRVSRLDGRVTLTIPTHASERDALGFAAEKADWLRKVLEHSVRAHRPEFGGQVPFEGRMLKITQGAVKTPRVEGDALLMPAGEDRLSARLETFLKFHARARVTQASDHYCARLGRAYSKITMRDARSRWGSCAPDGALMYNWRLIMAPVAVLDYVCAHEVAHLAQMNHSPAFWAVVADLRPSYPAERHWLKQHGTQLQALRFRD
ncbi:M48 family metallopeptidase [Albirhodobacter sp. R86504]|uniref:M48 family metallopeptidase n=1 Tax=Albirhodobacter sp. R86504 TaxID=3093848 RepID=UPI00366D6AC4